MVGVEGPEASLDSDGRCALTSPPAVSDTLPTSASIAIN